MYISVIFVLYFVMYKLIIAILGGIANSSIYITVQSKPLAHILGPHTLTRRAHTNAQFVCCIENALEMYWMDPQKNVLDRVKVNGSYNAVLDVQDVMEDGVWTCIAVRNNYTGKFSVTLLNMCF